MNENLKIEGNFKIQVRLIQGQIFTFNNVDGYEIEPGDLISFKDSKTGILKKFHTSNCEISPAEGGR